MTVVISKTHFAKEVPNIVENISKLIFDKRTGAKFICKTFKYNQPYTILCKTLKGNASLNKH